MLKIKSKLQSNLICPSLFNFLRVVQGQSAELLTQENLFQTIQSGKPDGGRHAQSRRFPICKKKNRFENAELSKLWQRRLRLRHQSKESKPDGFWTPRRS